MSLTEVANWLVQIGYPFDFSTTHLPPVDLRREIESAWVRKEGTGKPDLDCQIIDAVAEEGGWYDH